MPKNQDETLCPKCKSPNTEWIPQAEALAQDQEHNAKCLECGWKGDSYDLLDEYDLLMET